MDPNASVAPYSFMKGHSLPDKWKALEPIVTRLYIDQNLNLKEVTEIIRRQHGFDANERQYKYHIKKWKLNKAVPTTVKNKILRIIESRNAEGKPTKTIAYQGRPVDKRKLARQVNDQAKQALSTPLRFGFRASTPEIERQTPTPRMTNVMFAHWNMPYSAFKRSGNSVFEHDSPLPIGMSPDSNIMVATPSTSNALSPPADSPSGLSKALVQKRGLERARLFMEGKHRELLRSMETHEKIIMSEWHHQFWLSSYKKAREWNETNGPTYAIFDSVKDRESLPVSLPGTPGRGALVAASPIGIAMTSSTSSLLNPITKPSDLCRWAIHVPAMESDKKYLPNYITPSFSDEILNDLKENTFSKIDTQELPISIPHLLQARNISGDQFIEESLSFAIMSRNVELLRDLVKRISRKEREPVGIYPYHLAASHLCGSNPCCNMFYELLTSGLLFHITKLFVNTHGHTVLDQLMITIIKSHTSCSPGDLDETMRNEKRFPGEEVDICGRWDADSHEICALLSQEQSQIPSDWKHKFCHTSAQVICHSISTIFGMYSRPDINQKSGLFRKTCDCCGKALQLLPLHTLVMVALALAERGCAGEDLFGVIACLLCMLHREANPMLAIELSVPILFGEPQTESQATNCSHQELDAVQLAEQVPQRTIDRWSHQVQTGWKIFHDVLKLSKQHRQHLYDESDENKHSKVCGYHGVRIDLGPQPEITSLWLAIQTEMSTYRRLQVGDEWISQYINMAEIAASIRISMGNSIEYFKAGLPTEGCRCGLVAKACTFDCPCMQEVCVEHFSNMEDLNRTTYIRTNDVYL